MDALEGIALEGIGRERDIYARRFSDAQIRTRTVMWQVLCEQFFQAMVGSAAVVVDLGAGDGGFIRNIKAPRRIAVDLSEHVKQLESAGVEVLHIPATQLTALLPCRADFIFVSNFLEHLNNKTMVLTILEQCREVLSATGRLCVLQPNIRYTGPAYWDYIDHHIALTEHSLAEALDVSGFRLERLIPRFLPYTVRSRLGDLAGPFTRQMVSFYLKHPVLWRIFGQQTLALARPR